MRDANKTFEVSCTIVIPLCYDEGHAIQDFKNFVQDDCIQMKVKDVTEESEEIVA